MNVLKKIQLFPVEQCLTKNSLTEWDFKISHWWEPGFKALEYLEPEEFQNTVNYIMYCFLNKPWHTQNPCIFLYDEVSYSQAFVNIRYLDSIYIQTLRISKTQDIQNTTIFKIQFK